MLGRPLSRPTIPAEEIALSISIRIPTIVLQRGLRVGAPAARRGAGRERILGRAKGGLPGAGGGTEGKEWMIDRLVGRRGIDGGSVDRLIDLICNWNCVD